MLCEELTARPKETHLQPEITPSSLNISQRPTKNRPKISVPYRGDCNTHARTHTPVSQSVCPGDALFFSIFSLCFFSFFFFFSSFIERGYFLFLNRERRDDSKKGKWQWGVISKGNTTMLIALGPWKKRERKRGWVFFGWRWRTPNLLCTKKGLNIWDTGKSSFLYKYFSGIQNVQLV